MKTIGHWSMFMAILILIPFSAPERTTQGGTWSGPEGRTGILSENIERNCSPVMVAYNDSDGNRIDDHIDFLLTRNADAIFDVFVDYDRRIVGSHLDELAELGLYPGFVSKYIDVLILEDVSQAQMEEVLFLRDVVGIEYAPMLHPVLDISSKAVRVRSSEVYGQGVWDELGLTGTGVNVAIIDTGVDDMVHSGLRGKFVRGVDTSSPLGSVERNPDDGIGHGTHCAGIIMGTGSGGDQIGVAPNASLVDCKVGDTVTLGSATPTNFMEGLEWVADNARRYNISVLSISMGTEHSSNGNDASSRMANEVVNAGVVVVVAIGNDDGSQNANVVSSPGSADKVITVGALNDRNTITRSDDNIAGYSQSGPRPNDGDADREDELKPDVVAPGTDISSCMHNTRSSYIHFSGTSMATPHVAGVAALMKQAYPELQPRQVKDIIRHTAEHKGGVYNADIDEKYNTLYGWGMADAYGAVRRAKDMTSPRLDMPTSIDSGSRLTVKAAMDLSRNKNMVKADLIEWKVVLPSYFSEPDNITLTVHSDAQADLQFEPPRLEGEKWVLEARVDIKDITGDVLEASPELYFRTWAPHVGEEQQFRFILNTSLDGIECPGKLVELTVGGSPGHKVDLSINSNDISFSSNPADAGEEVDIYVNVSNVGLSDAFGVRVDFFDGNPQSGIPIGSDEIDVPGKGTSRALTTWTATPGALHNIFVVVDPDNELDEISETNNTASKPIVVSGGVNLAPTAELTVEPGHADIDEEVSFYGDKSTDKAGGQVTEWCFFYGDGNDSGWIPVSYADHRYSTAGTYSASLVVKDNGGKESTNDESVEITVEEMIGGNMGFYLAMGENLSISKPTGTQPTARAVPDGYTPYPLPGSPVGRVEYREVGTWKIANPRETRQLVERGTMSFWVRNTDGERGFNAQFRVRVKVEDETILDKESPEINVEPGSKPLLFQLSEDVDITMKYRHDVEITIEGKVNGEGLELVFDAERYPSGYTVKFLPVDNEPPIITEISDVVGRVGEDIVLEMSAKDEDGTIISYRWDFNNDQLWDTETQEPNVIHAFDIPDEHRVNVMVLDDDGAGTRGMLIASIYEKGESSPPNISIDFPSNGSSLDDITIFRGTADDDLGIEEIRASLDDSRWEVISQNESWEYEIDPGALESGRHVFSVIARDTDGQSSDTASVVFFIEAAGSPPVIASAEIEPDLVDNSGEGEVAVTICVTDEDGEGDIIGVVIDLRELGLGTPDCERTGPGEFLSFFNVPGGTPAGEKTITISVVDRSGRESRKDIELTVVEMNRPPELDAMTKRIRFISGKDEALLIAVKVSDPNGVDDMAAVLADLSPLGGEEEMEMNDEGMDGDGTAADGIYTLLYEIPPGTAPGRRKIRVAALDRGGLEASLELVVDVMKNPDEEVEMKESSGQTALYIGIVIAAAVVITCGAGYIFRRKYKSH